MENLEYAEQQRAMAEDVVCAVLWGYDAFVQCNLVIRDRKIKLQTIVGIKPEGETRDITIVTVSPIPPSAIEATIIGRSIEKQYLSDIA